MDLQCDPVNGDFYIYRGELIVHEGHIYDLVWDADAPREDISPPAPDQPPTNPIDLPYDEDYQGNALLPPLVLIDEDAEYCDVLCEDAATLTGRVNCEDTCPPDVCADGFSPDPVLPTYIYETVEGDSETAEEAIQNAKDNVDALDPCGSDDIQEPLVACFVKPIASGRWKVGIAVCCED